MMQVADLEAGFRGRPGARRRTAPISAPFVLLDDNLSPGGVARLFEEPVGLIRCDRPEHAEAALDELARALDRGFFAAGFLSYELGYLFEPKLAPLLPRERDQPLIWLGLFRAPTVMDRAAAGRLVAERTAGGHDVANLRLSQDRAGYLGALARVKEYIAAGDVYQINLTFKYLFDFAGDPLSLYGELRRKQRVAHGAFIHAPEFDVLSLSPELFLSIECGRVRARPMKGTAARRPTPGEDAAARAWLHDDPKSRAENLMIVDLLRNDLGRVAEIGSVAVPALFTVETYPTVHQMTSSVTGRLRKGVGAREVIRSLFPCGSVTGAPKMRAMEIIRELEAAPRGVYTGAVGMFGPDGEVALNVAIRTLMLHRGGRGELGIGSGIVDDSNPVAEFEECLLKARFLTAPFRPFRLIETLRWTPAEGYYLLSEHMARLAGSAAHFGYPCDPGAVRRRLDRAVAAHRGTPLRVRLTLGEDGDIEVTTTPLPPADPTARLHYALGDRPIDRDDPFFYHKTTRREVYDGELARMRAATGCDEVLLVNDRGELTEGSRTNIFVERGGRLLTPPVACGLLAGTLREALIRDGAAEERILRPADLSDAERVYLGNSVRGLLPAVPAT